MESKAPNQIERRIALVRHARSSHIHAGSIDASGFRAWREANEAAGIREDERVPTDLKELVDRADLVVASDAVRAVATARLLTPGREIVGSPLLRELDLEALDLGRLRLPLAAWALAVGGRNLLRTSIGSTRPRRKRHAWTTRRPGSRNSLRDTASLSL